MTFHDSWPPIRNISKDYWLEGLDRILLESEAFHQTLT